MQDDILNEFASKISKQEEIIKTAKMTKKDLKKSNKYTDLKDQNLMSDIDQKNNINSFNSENENMNSKTNEDKNTSPTIKMDQTSKHLDKILIEEIDEEIDEETVSESAIQELDQFEISDSIHTDFDFISATKEFENNLLESNKKERRNFKFGKKWNKDLSTTEIEAFDNIKNLENNKPELQIDIHDIKKHYGKKEVLKGINLKINKGEKLVLFGANGAGKSTLAEIICQIKEPSSGIINFSFGKSKSEISREIGVQFQESSYPFYFRVIDIIKFFSEATGTKLTKEKLYSLLEEFQLIGLEKRKAQTLSGGQKQRLNILLAVLNNPKLLILDEVSTGLDVESRTKVKKFIKDYLNKNNSTLILVSHNPDEIEYLVDRMVVIHDGLIFADEKIVDILEKYGTLLKYIDYLFLEAFLDDSEEGKINHKKHQISENNVEELSIQVIDSKTDLS